MHGLLNADSCLRSVCRHWRVTAALCMLGLLAACQADESIPTEGSWEVAPGLVGEWRVEAPAGVLTQPVTIEFGADSMLRMAGQPGASRWGLGRQIDDRIRIDVMLADGPATWWGTLSADGSSLQLDAMPGVWLRRAAAIDDRTQE
jgi:hypothetical protein